MIRIQETILLITLTFPSNFTIMGQNAYGVFENNYSMNFQMIYYDAFNQNYEFIEKA